MIRSKVVVHFLNAFVEQCRECRVFITRREWTTAQIEVIGCSEKNYVLKKLCSNILFPIRVVTGVEI